jgi:hypothetical protein
MKSAIILFLLSGYIACGELVAAQVLPGDVFAIGEQRVLFSLDCDCVGRGTGWPAVYRLTDS